MELYELNPHIRYASRRFAKIENKKQFSICYDCRLFFVEDAEGYVIANGKKYNISNGSAIYFPPRTKYRFHISEGERFSIIILDFDLTSDFCHLKNSLGTATEENFVPEKCPDYEINESLASPIVETVLQIKSSLLQCCEYFLLKSNLYRESSSALLKLCLLELVKDNSPKGSYSQLCKNVMNYIYKNYANQELSNSVIANTFNYHPYHLNQIMKEATGKSLHRHLTETRLRFAKNYLLTSQFSIEEVSWKSGFSSTSYFIKLFKESSGMTPKKYRQAHFHTDL